MPNLPQLIVNRGALGVAMLTLLLGFGFRNSALEQQADPPRPPIRQRVALDIQVQHKDTGRVILGLEKPDFAIFEDGVKQEISEFRRDDPDLSIVLLLDVSGSMKSQAKLIRSGFATTWSHFRAADEIAIMGFAGDVKLLQGFTRDWISVEAQVDRIYSEFPDLGKDRTNIYEAVLEASTYLKAAAKPGNRRIILALSDDMTNQEHAPKYRQTLIGLQQSGAIVYTLAVSQYPDMGLGGREPSLLDFVKETGGDYFNLERAPSPYIRQSRLLLMMQTLVDALPSRYHLVYLSTTNKPAGEYRKIKVEVSREVEKRMGGLRVLSRRGYYGQLGTAVEAPK